jgi:hypothetical protein
MLLGDLLTQFSDEAVALETLIALNDLPLLARVQDTAESSGLSPGEVAAEAVRIFSTQAPDEEWVSLMGVMGQSDAPGHTCLKRMIEFALRPAEVKEPCNHGH